MKKEKNWFYILAIIFCVSQISYLAMNEMFPWYSSPVFPILLPVFIFLFGWGICTLYTIFLHTKITTKKYVTIFSLLITMSTIFGYFLFHGYPDVYRILGVGLFLNVYSISLFYYLVDDRFSENENEN